MTVMGIETATDVCSVGIATGDGGTERSVRESRIHSERLIPIMKEVMDEMGLGWNDIDGFALSSGPGSFTGLRIGASAVKGVMTAVPRPFALVPTFEAIHDAWSRDSRVQEDVLLALDAKQDEWYVQEFTVHGSVGSLSLRTTEYVAGFRPSLPLLTDQTGRFSGRERVLDIRTWCSGLSVARRGVERIRNQEYDDVSAFEPTYWKDFVIRTAPHNVKPPRGTKET